MTVTPQRTPQRTKIAGISSVDAIGVAVVYLLTSVIKLSMLHWMRGDSTLTALMLKWDSRHYLDIAQYGYFQAAGEGPWDPAVYQERLAFFPGLPMLIRALALIPGVDHAGAGLFINAVACAVLGLGVVALAGTLGARFWERMLACVLILGAPMAITFHMVYTEAMFLACVVWALRAMLRREFLIAALITAVAGLTRLTAIDLWAVLVLAVVWHYWEPQIRRWLSMPAGQRAQGIAGGLGARAHKPVPDAYPHEPGPDAYPHKPVPDALPSSNKQAQSDGPDTQAHKPVLSGKWTALGAATLSIVPLAFYLLWASYYTRDVGGYFGIQRAGWHSAFDFGAATLRWVTTQMRETTEPGYVLSIVVILLAALTILLTFRCVPWQLWVFGLALGANVLLSDGIMHSRPRLLLPVLLLLLPLCVRWSRRFFAYYVPLWQTGLRSWRLWSVAVVWVVVGAWFSAYMLAVFPWAI